MNRRRSRSNRNPSARDQDANGVVRDEGTRKATPPDQDSEQTSGRGSHRCDCLVEGLHQLFIGEQRPHAHHTKKQEQRPTINRRKGGVRSKDAQGDAWIYVPAGTCEKIAGGTVGE